MMNRARTEAQIMEKLKKNLAVLWTRYHRKRRSHLLVELRR
jgi:hypothetical protein